MVLDRVSINEIMDVFQEAADDFFLKRDIDFHPVYFYNNRIIGSYELKNDNITLFRITVRCKDHTKFKSILNFCKKNIIARISKMGFYSSIENPSYDIFYISISPKKYAGSYK